MDKSTKGYALLKNKEFSAYLLGKFFYNIAFQFLLTSVGWQLYAITGSNLYIGFMGLSLALPYIIMALFAGYIADHFSRKKIIALSILGLFFCSIGVYAYFSERLHLYKSIPLVFFYSILGIAAICKAFLTTAYKVLFAQILQKKDYTQGATLDGTNWQISFLVGPLISGICLAWLGIDISLMIVSCILVLSFLSFTYIKDKQILNTTREPIFTSLKAGIGFVRKTPVLLGAITLDMFAVLFGGVTAILPSFVKDVLHGDEVMFGTLRVAIFVGATLMGIFLSYYPPYKKAGRNLFMAVFGFGLCMIAFAFTKNFYMAFLALFMAGIFDCVSVVIRSAIFQIYTPDEMRGRVSAVNSIFITSSNEFGEFESGLAATKLGLVPSIIFGGSMTLLTVSFIKFTFSSLSQLDLTKGFDEESH